MYVFVFASFVISLYICQFLRPSVFSFLMYYFVYFVRLFCLYVRISLFLHLFRSFVMYFSMCLSLVSSVL